MVWVNMCRCFTVSFRGSCRNATPRTPAPAPAQQRPQRFVGALEQVPMVRQVGGQHREFVDDHEHQRLSRRRRVRPGVTGQLRGAGGHRLDGVLEQDDGLLGGGGVAGEQSQCRGRVPSPPFRSMPWTWTSPARMAGARFSSSIHIADAFPDPDQPAVRVETWIGMQPRLAVLGDPHLRRGDVRVPGSGKGTWPPSPRRAGRRTGTAACSRYGCRSGSPGPAGTRPRSGAVPTPSTMSSTVCPTISCGTTTSTSGSSQPIRCSCRHPEFGPVPADHPTRQPARFHQRTPRTGGRNAESGAARPGAHVPEVGVRPAPCPQRRHHRRDRSPVSSSQVCDR